MDDLLLDIPVFNLLKIEQLIGEQLGEEWGDRFNTICPNSIHTYVKNPKTQNPLYRFLNSVLESQSKTATIMIMVENK